MNATSARASQLDQKLREIHDSGGVAQPEEFKAISVLFVDAVLEKDTEALATAQRGLQHIFGHLYGLVQPSTYESRCLGRVEEMIESATWALWRLATEQARKIEIKPGSTEHHLMAAIKKRRQTNSSVEVLVYLLPGSRDTATVRELLLKLEQGGLVYWTRTPSSVILTDEGYRVFQKLTMPTPNYA